MTDRGSSHRAAIAADPTDCRGWHNKAQLQRLAGQYAAAKDNAGRALAAARVGSPESDPHAGWPSH